MANGSNSSPAQLVPTPNLAKGGWLNGAFSTGTDDVWSVGYTLQKPPNQTPLIQHWDGAEWSIVPGPRLRGAYTQLSNVVSVSPARAAAVGQTTDEEGEFLPVVEEWDGAAWSLANVPVPAGWEGFLYGVGADGAGGFWAVGYVYRANPNLIYRTYIVRSTPG